MMPRIKPLLVLCAALLTVTPAASADVNSDMNQFFNKLGFASNTTQPGVWQGQAAGYAYGGSLYARTQVKNVHLISMTLPDINAGCGGIDAYLGSFSFINSEQLQRFVKQIMSNAAGYFFDLALQTTVPEIKTAKDFLQKMASDINSMNLSSCQAAQGIIGGLFPRTQVSQQKVCQDIAGESNIFADWAASRQGCTVGGKSDSVRDKASDKDKERVTKNINIMWNALSKNRMFDGNKELKEFVMTLTGSLVFGPNGEITPLSARTTDRSIIRAMMEGGTAKIYHCNDSDKCLKVVADTPVTISRDNALKSQITKLLASIQNKAVSDTPLDDKEKGFISSTTIPVFKYLVDPQMLGVSNSMIYQLTDYIGYDILLQYIQELIQQARAMVATGNYDEAVIEHINDNINDATRQIAAFQSQVQVQQDALLVVDRQMPGKICCRGFCSRWSGIWFVTCRKRKPWAETDTGRQTLMTTDNTNTIRNDSLAARTDTWLQSFLVWSPGQRDIIKTVALVLMVLDHINLIFQLKQEWMFLVGRGAFPLFALVWGLNLSRHAHIRQPAINRLWGWGIIAQFAYYLAGFPWYEGHILFAFAVVAQVLTWCETRSGWRTAAAILLMAQWGPLSGTSYGIAGLLMLAVSHRLYRAEDRAERLALVACLLAVIPALNLATSDAAAVAGLVMTVLTVGLVSCAGKSLPRFWPGDFFPTFYACHLAVLGVLAL
ncbi:type-F conjugative transfer system pilin acetylase TraX [Escherichia coli]|nr:type-F conjugative transfer system pilin acetylase TraX [Escherichia coli]